MSIINHDIKCICDDLFNHSDLSCDDLYDNELYEECVNFIYNIYAQIFDKECFNQDYLINQIKSMLDKYIKLDDKINYNKSDIEYLTHHIKWLEQLPQPEQRSEEWYEFRKNRLTASDLLGALDKKSSKYTELLLKKCYDKNTNFPMGEAILHGIKFEPVATSIYEKRYNLQIIEFGCLPHNTIDYFGASPDGIVSYDSENKNYVGRMLEIKCPKSRKITGIIPEGYYAQIQGQLEVCDLEYCDFLECDFQKYNSEEEFFNDTHNDNKLLNKKGYEKGIIIELYNKQLNKNIYKYCENEHIISQDTFKKWENNILEKLFSNENDDNIEYINSTFWYLNKINIVLVKRDKKWFRDKFLSIKEFWDDVIKNRKDNCETLLKNKKNKKKNNYNYVNKHDLELNFID